MSSEVNSFSSALMLETTLFRNQPGRVNKVIAEVAYGAIFFLSIGETASSLAVSGVSLLVYPFTHEPLEGALRWLHSSFLTLAWSGTDIMLNPFCHTLVADELSAYWVLKSGEILTIPRNALI